MCPRRQGWRAPRIREGPGPPAAGRAHAASAAPPYAPMASSVVRSRSVSAGLSGVPSSAARLVARATSWSRALPPLGHRVGVAGRLPPLEHCLLAGAHAIGGLEKGIEIAPRGPIQLVHQPGREARLGQPAHARRLVVTPLLLQASRKRRCARRRIRQTAPGNSVSSSRSRSVTEDWQEERPRSYPYQS